MLFYKFENKVCKLKNHYNKWQRAKTQPAYNQYDELVLGVPSQYLIKGS
jgi:hypothetical protein